MSAESLNNFIEVDVATFGAVDSAAGDPVQGGPFLLQPDQWITIHRRDGRKYRLELTEVTGANT